MAPEVRDHLREYVEAQAPHEMPSA
jgi:hypothetical protein